MKAVVLFCLSLFSSAAFEYNLKPVEVTKDIYCFFGKPEMITKENGGNMVNSCYVRTKEGYVVIDSGPTFLYAQNAYAIMQKVEALPVKYVITTHEHDDHWLGNSFYKTQGALLIGPRTYEQNIAGKEHSMHAEETRMAHIVTKDTFEGTVIVALDRVVDETPYLFTLGRVKFEVKRLVNIAHTKSDLVVYMPEKKVVFTGDLVFNDRLTSIRDGSIIGSLKAIEALEKLEADTIITGHGTMTDKSATARQKDYLAQMKEEVLKAIDEGIGLDKITQVVKMEAYKSEGMYEVLHNSNVLKAYTELEMYDEEEDE